VSRRSLHAGRIGDFGLEDVVLPNGRAVTLEVLRHPGASAVLPLHADGTVTLLRQHRHAAGGTIWEIPAGKLEPGEAPETCAARELQEEAGLVGTLEPLGFIFPAPAYTDEQIHLFLATGLTAAPAAPEADEVLEPVRLPLSEALAMVQRGDIVDAKTIAALLHAVLRRP
jgi:ADP-ribose pyrophosphatase